MRNPMVSLSPGNNQKPRVVSPGNNQKLSGFSGNNQKPSCYSPDLSPDIDRKPSGFSLISLQNSIYVGGSKSSETNPIPENWFILRDWIMVLLLEVYVPDRINASPWLVDDVITYYSWSRDVIYGDPVKALTHFMKWLLMHLLYCFSALNQVDRVVHMLNNM